MMKIYIDITNLMMVSFLTGIQRVVREVVMRILNHSEFEIVLLEYKSNVQKFNILSNDEFYAYYQGKTSLKRTIRTDRWISINELEGGSVFFDIDSVWNSSCPRSALFPQLKNQGLKIASYIYDTIPINNPQYCHTRTILKFMDYFGANLRYADAVVVSTQSVLDSIYEIADRLRVERVPGYVSWLGADFTSENKTSDIRDDVEELVCSGKKYILTVGTIEPRKNHKILLDAFDQKLFDEELNLVFVGRIGWNVDELRKRIASHEYGNQKFFHFVGLDDNNVDYLYRNSYLVAFPTFDEGFGLPMIEAFQRGTPVIASDCKVLQEVGGNNAIYFSPDSVDDFVGKITELLEQPDKYDQLKSRVKGFVPFTWDQTTENIIAALKMLDTENKRGLESVKQMVVLSARCRDICGSLPFVEYYMPFIEELVLCCPNSMKVEFLETYSGRLTVTILTDSEILDGRALPEDHQTRNFFLRSLVMRRKELDDVFIMSDDDYRPLETITADLFIKDGRYQAYYCYSLKSWRGTAGKMTSYDIGMFRTLEFLETKLYPARQYSAHMPQIIDKARYQEFLDSHEGIERLGLDEWSSYFNWLQYKYPKLMDSLPYVTMGWPGVLTDWKMNVYPEKYFFENYYESLYEENQIFEGMPNTLGTDVEVQNKKKKTLFMDQQRQFMQYEYVYSRYKELYAVKHNEVPSFVFVANEKIEIHTPQYIVFPLNGFVRIPARMCIGSVVEGLNNISISYFYAKGVSKLLEVRDVVKFEAENTDFEIPVWGKVNCRGEMDFTLIVDYDNKQYTKSIKAFLVDAESFLNATEAI
ncbi:MAG: glycosyltransferase family 4 protein [Lachnospiraceae bacterium]